MPHAKAQRRQEDLVHSPFAFLAALREIYCEWFL